MTATGFLLISQHEEDLRMAEYLAFAHDLTLSHAKTTKEAIHLLHEPREYAVLWDGQMDGDSEEIVEVLKARVPSSRVFVVTDDALTSCPSLAKQPVFDHHFLRRYDDPAAFLFSRVLASSLEGGAHGLSHYFPDGAARSKIQLTRSGHKRAAVEAIQNFFTKQNVNTRLSSLVAQAADELLMNAIFDAPVLPNGMSLRRGTPRDADFELIEKEHVRMEVASGPDYVGISVVDQFGSLQKEVLLRFLTQNYEHAAYDVRKPDPGAGLGLSGLFQTGLSLVFACDPGVRTEVMVFFARNASYKDFRSGFRFLSVLAP